MLLLIYCFMFVPLCVGVLCWFSLFKYVLLYSLSIFAIILTRKRELVAFILLSFECHAYVNAM